MAIRVLTLVHQSTTAAFAPEWWPRVQRAYVGGDGATGSIAPPCPPSIRCGSEGRQTVQTAVSFGVDRVVPALLGHRVGRDVHRDPGAAITMFSLPRASDPAVDRRIDSGRAAK